jgi:sterol desaturase/sphingolipid hydroxylase (fatty acid hydroxylase superfamily)
LYGIFIGAAIANALGPRLSFFKIEMLAALPAPIHWILYWIALDFLDYWYHRLRHSWGFLWAIHSIHHSQERMTFATSWRSHPLDLVIGNCVMFVPLLLLGIPTKVWFPLIALQYAFEAVQHSQLGWRYGPLYRVFVSPAFHNVHHSAERRYHDSNYGKLLSVWDFLFGTAVKDQPRPAVTGIAGICIPESILQQLLVPFKYFRGVPGRDAVPTHRR